MWRIHRKKRQIVIPDAIHGMRSRPQRPSARVSAPITHEEVASSARDAVPTTDPLVDDGWWNAGRPVLEARQPARAVWRAQAAASGALCAAGGDMRTACGLPIVQSRAEQASWPGG